MKVIHSIKFNFLFSNATLGLIQCLGIKGPFVLGTTQGRPKFCLFSLLFSILHFPWNNKQEFCTGNQCMCNFSSPRVLEVMGRGRLGGVLEGLTRHVKSWWNTIAPGGVREPFREVICSCSLLVGRQLLSISTKYHYFPFKFCHVSILHSLRP